MKKPTKVKMGTARRLYKLRRPARHAPCHFEIKIEAYYVCWDGIGEARPVGL